MSCRPTGCVHVHLSELHRELTDCLSCHLRLRPLSLLLFPLLLFSTLSSPISFLLLLSRLLSSLYLQSSHETSFQNLIYFLFLTSSSTTSSFSTSPFLFLSSPPLLFSHLPLFLPFSLLLPFILLPASRPLPSPLSLYQGVFISSSPSALTGTMGSTSSTQPQTTQGE